MEVIVAESLTGGYYARAHAGAAPACWQSDTFATAAAARAAAEAQYMGGLVWCEPDEDADGDVICVAEF